MWGSKLFYVHIFLYGSGYYLLFVFGSLSVWVDHFLMKYHIPDPKSCKLALQYNQHHVFRYPNLVLDSTRLNTLSASQNLTDDCKFPLIVDL